MRRGSGSDLAGTVAGWEHARPPGARPITVLIADSNLLLADALAQALDWWPDLEVMEEHPASGEDAVQAVTARRPDVALLDYWMVGMDGPPAVRLIREQISGQRVLLLSWFHTSREVAEAFEAGAVGFLPRSMVVDQVADAVRRAHAGESPVYPAEVGGLVEHAATLHRERDEVAERLATLSSREREILTLLAGCRTVAQAAESLGISRGTIRNHIHNILQKTGATSHSQAVAWARYWGLIRI
ncbi:MAG: response regulator [Actinomycetota bacterium]